MYSATRVTLLAMSGPDFLKHTPLDARECFANYSMVYYAGGQLSERLAQQRAWDSYKNRIVALQSGQPLPPSCPRVQHPRPTHSVLRAFTARLPTSGRPPLASERISHNSQPDGSPSRPTTVGNTHALKSSHKPSQISAGRTRRLPTRGAERPGWAVHALAINQTEACNHAGSRCPGKFPAAGPATPSSNMSRTVFAQTAPPADSSRLSPGRRGRGPTLTAQDSIARIGVVAHERPPPRSDHVLVFSGLSTATTAEALLACVEAVGPAATVEGVDYRRGAASGFVRLQAGGRGARAIADLLVRKAVCVCDARPAVLALGGKEESAFWERKHAEDMKKKRRAEREAKDPFPQVVILILL